MNDVPIDTAELYDRVTEAWTLLLGDDLHYGVFEHGTEDLAAATRTLTRRMVAAAQLAPGQALLDVGSGTGAPACLLASTCGVHVTGITTSTVGVDTARARAASLGLDQQTAFLRRDGMDNGFADASFDRVWVLESSHLMRDKARLVAECARVLRPGGRMVLCDIVLRRPMPFDEVRRLRRELALLRDVFGDAHMERLERYRELAAAHGLVVDTETDLTDETRPTFARWRTHADSHRDHVTASLGERGWQQFVDACGVLDAFWADGTLGYGLVAAAKP